MGNLNMLKERNPQACLSRGCDAEWYTRWRGLESHLSGKRHRVILYQGVCLIGQEGGRGVGHPQGYHMSGKNQGGNIFIEVRKMSGNLSGKIVNFEKKNVTLFILLQIS